MHVPRRSPRRRTLLLTLLFGVIGLLVVGTFAESQGKAYTPRNNEKDKRNTALGEINGANPANDCWQHHKGEGMRDTVVVYPVVPQQLQLNKQQEIPVIIFNPWKQELRDMSLEVTLLGEDQFLTVEGQASSAAASTDVKYTFPTRCMGPAQQTVEQNCPKQIAFTFSIPTGAQRLIATAEFYPGGGPPDPFNPNDEYSMGFRYNTSKLWRDRSPADNATRTQLQRTLVSNLTGGGTGVIEMIHTAGPSLRTQVFLNVTIIMGASGGGGEKTYAIKVPFDNVLKQSSIEVPVKVTPFAKGTQQMEFRIRAQNYYKHQDPSTPNEDYYTRFATLDKTEDLIRGNTITPMRAVVVGDSFIASPYGAPVAAEPSEDWRFVLAEISGFSAAGLLLPSLLLGGTYGKGSRRFFNNLLGGAKRRVMFHNIMSLGLSLVAVVHILLFMLEIRYTILMGIMWGGLGALSLLMLGLTGYYQVPLIQRHGYKWWRVTHLAFGLLVVVFVSYHAIADGPDFFFLKEQLPKWINDVNLAQK